MVQIGDKVVIRSASRKIPFQVEHISLDGTITYIKNLKHCNCFYWATSDLEKYNIHQPEFF